jgi:two-component system sensor kinase FixL
MLTLSGRSGKSVELAVTDTGIGIPAEQLTRITEPLFTTKAKGLGLGLALSRAILEKNQGSLHVTSQPGVGTTFTIRLTVAPPARIDR